MNEGRSHQEGFPDRLPEQLIPPEHQDPENVQRAMVCWIIACVLFFVGLFGIVLWICLWPVAAVFAIFGLKYFYTPAEGTGNTSGGAENV